jgi:hypothetical protein
MIRIYGTRIRMIPSVVFQNEILQKLSYRDVRHLMATSREKRDVCNEYWETCADHRTCILDVSKISSPTSSGMKMNMSTVQKMRIIDSSVLSNSDITCTSLDWDHVNVRDLNKLERLSCDLWNEDVVRWLQTNLPKNLNTLLLSGSFNAEWVQLLLTAFDIPSLENLLVRDVAIAIKDILNNILRCFRRLHYHLMDEQKLFTAVLHGHCMFAGEKRDTAVMIQLGKDVTWNICDIKEPRFSGSTEGFPRAVQTHVSSGLFRDLQLLHLYTILDSGEEWNEMIGFMGGNMSRLKVLDIGFFQGLLLDGIRFPSPAAWDRSIELVTFRGSMSADRVGGRVPGLPWYIIQSFSM